LAVANTSLTHAFILSIGAPRLDCHFRALARPKEVLFVKCQPNARRPEIAAPSLPHAWGHGGDLL
jgi:hypothetical protein